MMIECLAQAASEDDSERRVMLKPSTLLGNKFVEGANTVAPEIGKDSG